MTASEIAVPGPGESSWVSRIRRNHGLEHATLHVLGGRLPRQSIAGHSDWGGFWIIGNLPIEMLAEAVQEALQRLRSGEAGLAVHPNCGTNFVTAGILAGSVAGLTMWGSRRRRADLLDRLPVAITLATLALVAAQPLGLAIQQHFTVSGQPGDLRVVQIVLRRPGSPMVHRITTEG